MEFWIEHFSSALNYIFLSIPSYLAMRFLYLKAFKKNFIWKRELLMFIFVMYMVALFSQTIFISLPKNIYNIFPLYLKGRINTYSFQVFFDSFKHIKLGNFNYFIVNVLGNILAFVPLGIFVPLLFSKRKVFSVVMTGFLISLFIELLQLTVIRGTDVDDVMLNTMGSLIGYLIYRFMIKKQ